MGRQVHKYELAKAVKALHEFVNCQAARFGGAQVKLTNFPSRTDCVLCRLLDPGLGFGCQWLEATVSTERTPAVRPKPKLAAAQALCWPGEFRILWKALDKAPPSPALVLDAMPVTIQLNCNLTRSLVCRTRAASFRTRCPGISQGVRPIST